MGFIPSDDDKFDLDEARDRIAQKYGVPKAVWKKMVGQESGGDESAVSAKKATSAWQIMPATAKGLGIDPSDPLQAAEGGLRLLRDNYKRFRPKAKNEKHAWMMAVAGYHGNPENVEKDLKKGGYGLPNISDGAITTRDHVLKIFDGLDDVYDRSPLGTVNASPSNTPNGTSYDPNDQEPRPVEVKIGGRSAEKYASEEEIAQYEAKFGKVAPGIIPDSARKPQIPTTSPTIPVPSRLNPQAAPGQAEQGDPTQPRKLSLKTATGSELVESDDPTPVPAGKRRLVDKANGKTYLATEGARTKTEQGEQINYNIEREIPDYLAGKSKPNAVLMPNDPAAVQAYKVLRDHTGLPDTAELRRRFIAGYEAVKRGERTEIFSRSEQGLFDDMAALRAEQAEKQASAPKQRGKAVQPQKAATQTAFSEAPTTASELPHYQFEKTGKLTLNNGTELALVKDTEESTAPAGFARFQDADGETYLLDKASGKLKDESLAAVADTLPLTLVPYNQRNSVGVDQAKRQQAFQVASQLAAKYSQIDSTDAYQWLLARGFTDLATGRELPADRYYQSADANRGARNRSMGQGNAVGAPGSKGLIDSTPDDYYQLTRRDLRDMTAYTLEARKNREDEAMRLVAQGVTLTPEFLRQNRIKPEDLEKRRDDYEMAKVQGKVSREQMERLMPQLIAQGNDPYRAAILARKRLGFARDASGKDTADAELAAYDRLKNEQIKENSVAFNQDRAIADLQKMQIAGSYGLNHKNFDAEWKNKIETDAYQHVARMMKRHGSALAVEAAKAFEIDQEAARVERVKRMGWGEYLSAQPRQIWGNLNKGLVGMLISESLRGSVVYSKAAIDFLESVTGSGELWGKSKVEDHPWYKASKAVDKWFDENFTTNKDLDQEILSGQVPHAIGTSIAFLFPSLAKNPRAAIALMSTLQMGGGNFEEAIQAGASEEDAMRYALMSSAALGWTEILGISQAFTRLIKGVGGTTAKQFMREFLKSAPREVAEEVFLNEGPQTVGQNVLARLTYDPDRKWDKGLANAVAVATLSAGAMSGFITGVNTLRNQRLINATLKFDAANGGPAVRNLGVSGLYVKGKPQPITDELKPLVEKHTDYHDRIVSNFEAIEKIRERAKGLNLDQRLKLFRTVRRLQEENLELGREQAKIAEKIVEVSGVPDPDILEQVADYEDARAEARGEVVAVPDAAGSQAQQQITELTPDVNLTESPVDEPQISGQNMTENITKDAPVADQAPSYPDPDSLTGQPITRNNAVNSKWVALTGSDSIPKGAIVTLEKSDYDGHVTLVYTKPFKTKFQDEMRTTFYAREGTTDFAPLPVGYDDLATPQPEHIAPQRTSEERFEAAKRRAEGPKTRASQIDEKAAAVEQAAPAQAKPLTPLQKFEERKLGRLGYNEEQRAELTPEQRKQVLKDRIKRSDFFRRTPKIIKPVTLPKPALVEFSVRGMYRKLKNSHNVARLRRAGWTFKNLNKKAVTVTGAPEGVLEANIAGGEFENAVYNIDAERIAQRKPSSRAGKPFFQAKKGSAQTLTDFVRSEGGIREDNLRETRKGRRGSNSGELDRIRSIPGLVNNQSGVSAEDMARRAHEAGYFPGADAEHGSLAVSADELLEALEMDARGIKVIRSTDDTQHGEGGYEDEIIKGEHDRIRKAMLEDLLTDLTPEEMRLVESIADFLSDEEVWPIFEDAEFNGEISPENRDKAVKRGLQYGVEKNVTDWFIQTLKEFTDRQRSARESAPQISETEPQGPEPGGQSGETAESPDDSIYAEEFGDAYEPEDAESIGFDPSEFEDEEPDTSDLFDAALAELKAEAEPTKIGIDKDDLGDFAADLADFKPKRTKKKMSARRQSYSENLTGPAPEQEWVEMTAKEWAEYGEKPKDEFDAIDDIINSRLNSVELTTEQKETYALLKTHFESAYAKGEGDAAAQTKAFLKKLNERFDLEKIEKLKPFIVAFLEEKKAPTPATIAEDIEISDTEKKRADELKEIERDFPGLNALKIDHAKYYDAMAAMGNETPDPDDPEDYADFQYGPESTRHEYFKEALILAGELRAAELIVGENTNKKEVEKATKFLKGSKGLLGPYLIYTEEFFGAPSAEFLRKYIRDVFGYEFDGDYVLVETPAKPDTEVVEKVDDDTESEEEIDDDAEFDADEPTGKKITDDSKYEFSSTQLTYPRSRDEKNAHGITRYGDKEGDKIVKQASMMIAAEDLYEPEGGLEDKPHITIKYGIHSEKSDDVAPAFAPTGPITIELGRTAIFDTNPDYDVVYVKVKENAALRALNARVGKTTEVTDTFPTYRPHMTLAYVKKGRGEKYIGERDFDGHTFTFDSADFSSKTGEMVAIPLKKTTSEERFEQQKDQYAETPDEVDHYARVIGRENPFKAGDEAQGPIGAPRKVAEVRGSWVLFESGGGVKFGSLSKVGETKEEREAEKAAYREKIGESPDKPTSEQTTGTRTETSEPTVQKTDAAAPKTSADRYEAKKQKSLFDTDEPKKLKLSDLRRGEYFRDDFGNVLKVAAVEGNSVDVRTPDNDKVQLVGDRTVTRISKEQALADIEAAKEKNARLRQEKLDEVERKKPIERDARLAFARLFPTADKIPARPRPYLSDDNLLKGDEGSSSNQKTLEQALKYREGKVERYARMIYDFYKERLNDPDISKDDEDTAGGAYDVAGGNVIGNVEGFAGHMSTAKGHVNKILEAMGQEPKYPVGDLADTLKPARDAREAVRDAAKPAAVEKPETTSEERLEAEQQRAAEELKAQYPIGTELIRGEGKPWTVTGYAENFGGKGQLGVKLKRGSDSTIMGAKELAEKFTAPSTDTQGDKKEVITDINRAKELIAEGYDRFSRGPAGRKTATFLTWPDYGKRVQIADEILAEVEALIPNPPRTNEGFADISPLDTPEKRAGMTDEYVRAYNEDPGAFGRGLLNFDPAAALATAKTDDERKKSLEMAAEEAKLDHEDAINELQTKLMLHMRDKPGIQGKSQTAKLERERWEKRRKEIQDRIDRLILSEPFSVEEFAEAATSQPEKAATSATSATTPENTGSKVKLGPNDIGTLNTAISGIIDNRVPQQRLADYASDILSRNNEEADRAAVERAAKRFKNLVMLGIEEADAKTIGDINDDLPKMLSSLLDEELAANATSNEVEKEAQPEPKEKTLDFGNHEIELLHANADNVRKLGWEWTESGNEITFTKIPDHVKDGTVRVMFTKAFLGLPGAEAQTEESYAPGDMIEFELFDMKLRGTILEEHSPSMWNVQTRERDRLIPKNKVLRKVDSLVEPEPEQFDTGLQTDLFGNPVAPPKLPKPPKGEKVESGSLFDMSGLDEEGLFAQGGPKPIEQQEAADTGKADTAADLLQKQADAEQRLNTEAFGDEPGAWITEIANRHTSPTATDVAKTLIGKRQAIIDRGGPAQDLVADIVPAMLEAAEAEVRGLTFDDYIRQSWLGKEDLTLKQREIYDRIAEGTFSQYFNDELNALEEVKQNAPSGRADLAEDSSGVGRIPDAVRQEIPDAEPSADDRAAPETSRQPETTETRPGSNYSLFGDGPIVSGEGSDLDLRPKASDDQGSPAGSALDERGGDNFDPRASAEYKPSDAVREEAERSRSDVIQKRVAQNAAEDIEAVHGDLDNIRRTLPFLHDHQQDDVHFAETRFTKSDGVMFTNGTGTGKTFVGLGIAKRFHKQGKRNGIIVAPNDKILSDWQQSALNLNLHLKKLADTQDNGGTGTVLTTFANFRANKQLVERDWDFVIFDEAHYLGQNKDGNDTSALAMMRATTLHPRGAYSNHLVKNAEKIEEVTGLAMEAARIEKERRRTYDRDKRREVSARLEAAESKLRSAQRELDALQKAAEDEFEAKLKAGKRSKVTFLSATPFAYEKNVEYAEGYLFDYGPEPENVGGWGVPSAKDQFFITNFGYRMRYGKLTKPDADVNTELMEQEFNASLKKSGALSGRRIDIDRDYSRQFIVAESAIGNKIDEGFAFLRDKSRDDALSDKDRRAWRALAEGLDKRFNYLAKRFTLEAINARSAIPYIKQHLAMNRKVVVFHDYNKNEAIHPFDLSEDFKESELLIFGDQMITKGHWDMLAAARPDLVNLDLSSLVRPQDLFEQEFGQEIGFFNGTVPKKKRREVADDFNADLGTIKILVAQSDAGKEGISLHDTTGKYQRVLINLGLPVKPTASIQTEGRIYRDGNMSDAIQLYMTTGTNFEQFAFGQTISQRASTAENLALGAEARALKQAFIDGYIEADPDYTPSEYEGKGGKEKDRHIGAPLSEYDRAKGFYFGQSKKTSRTKAQEGADYYATPEPVGFKMVEWADQRPMEHAIEPSAGHGAIARWFRPDNYRTVVEPSNTLAARLALATDARMVREPFEDLHHGANKADTIVMNPPFGVGGKTAIEHLAKAFKHLNNGGRVVALIPAGPAADKRLEQLLESEAAKHILQIADIKMPPVTFKRAGTQVPTHILVLEKQLFKPDADKVTTGDEYDFSDITDIKELFDAIEDVQMPSRIDPTFDAVPVAPAMNEATRAVLVARVAQASRGQMPEIREKIEIKGDDGKWYRPTGFPLGVKATDETRSVGFSFVDKNGIGQGKLASSRQELIDEFNEKQDASVDAFLGQLSAMSDEQIKSQADYWLKKPLHADAADAEPSRAPSITTDRNAVIEPTPRPITEARLDADSSLFDKAEFNHTKTGAPIFVAKLKAFDDINFKHFRYTVAPRYGGYFSKYKGSGAVPGFHFKTPEAREQFIQEAEAHVGSKRLNSAIVSEQALERAQYQPPYTTSVLQNEQFKNLAGRSVKADTIKQVLKQQSVKAIERDIVNTVLEDPAFIGQTSISWDAFKEAVQLELMPLRVIETLSHATYGLDNTGIGELEQELYRARLLTTKGGRGSQWSWGRIVDMVKATGFDTKWQGEGEWHVVLGNNHTHGTHPEYPAALEQLRGLSPDTAEAVDEYNQYMREGTGQAPRMEPITHIYNTDLEHGVTGHFGGDFNTNPNPYQTGRMNNAGEMTVEARYLGWEVQEREQNGRPLFIVIREGSNPRTEEDLQANLGTVTNSREQAEEWIKSIGNRSQVNKGMFGHTRVAYAGDKGIIIELQSDVYQKHKAEELVMDAITRNRNFTLGDAQYTDAERLLVRFNELDGAITSNFTYGIRSTEEDAKRWRQEIEDYKAVKAELEAATPAIEEYLNRAIKANAKTAAWVQSELDKNFGRVTDAIFPPGSRTEYTQGEKTWIVERDETVVRYGGIRVSETQAEGGPPSRGLGIYDNIFEALGEVSSKAARAITDDLKTEVLNDQELLGKQFSPKVLDYFRDTGRAISHNHASLVYQALIGSWTVSRLADQWKGIENTIEGLDIRATTIENALKSPEYKQLQADLGEKEEVRKKLIAALPLKYKQFIAHRKNYTARLLREEVRNMAQKGLKEVWVVTPRTAALVEGFLSGSDGELMPYTIVDRVGSGSRRGVDDESDLEVQDRIQYLGKEWTVVDIDRNGGIVIALSEEVFTYDEYEEQEYQTKELFRRVEEESGLADLNGTVYEVEEGEAEITSLLKDSGIYRYTFDPRDVFDVEEVENGDADIEQFTFDWPTLKEDLERDGLWEDAAEYRDDGQDWEHVVEIKPGNMPTYQYVEKGTDTETLEQPGQYAKPTDIADFNLDDYSGTQRTILDKYVELNDLVKKEYENVEIKTDPRGNEYLAFPIAEDTLDRGVRLFSRELSTAQQARVSDLGFYSGVEQAILDKMPEKATAAHILGILTNPQNGAKQEELDWIDIESWLKSKGVGYKFTRDEVLEYVRANQVDVREVVKDSEGNSNDEENGVRGVDGTKYDQYTLPGGENYREILLTMPQRALDPRRVTVKPTGQTRPASMVDATLMPVFKIFLDGNPVNNEVALTAEDAKRQYIEKYPSQVNKDEYKSPHWDERNVLAHVRFDERDGGKTLHVAEIQSDFGQQLRKERGKIEKALEKDFEAIVMKMAESGEIDIVC